MRKKVAFRFGAVAFAVTLLGSVAPSQAGGRDCRGQCYEQVPAPAIYTSWLRRDTLRHGVYEIDREASVYGTATRRVLVDDGIEWDEEPAIYKTVKVRKHIGSHVRWEMRWIDGKYVKCKIKVPSRTVWINKKVLVKAGHRWKVRSNPTYTYVSERVLVRPYKNLVVYHRPVHRYVREKVVIQPEYSVWAPMRSGKDW